MYQMIIHSHYYLKKISIRLKFPDDKTRYLIVDHTNDYDCNFLSQQMGSHGAIPTTIVPCEQPLNPIQPICCDKNCSRNCTV